MKDRPNHGRYYLASGKFPYIQVALFAAVLSLGISPAHSEEGLPDPQGEVILRILGNVAQPNAGDEVHFDREMIEALPRHTLETSTSVTDGVNLFEGVLMRDILEVAGAEGEITTAIALNDYVIDIPTEDFHSYDVLAALYMDGERLLPRDKGPIWIVYPRDDFPELTDIRYDYRWVWQLTRLEIR
jgi:hypothetical protein